MRSFSVTLTGHLLGNTTTDELAEHLRNAGDFLVPGVTDWEGVTAYLTHEDSASVVAYATVVASDKVPDSDMAGYQGQEVTSQFVHDYIMGAADSWLIGDIFSPSSVSAVPVF